MANHSVESNKFHDRHLDDDDNELAVLRMAALKSMRKKNEETQNSHAERHGYGSGDGSGKGNNKRTLYSKCNHRSNLIVLTVNEEKSNDIPSSSVSNESFVEKRRALPERFSRIEKDETDESDDYSDDDDDSKDVNVIKEIELNSTESDDTQNAFNDHVVMNRLNGTLCDDTDQKTQENVNTNSVNNSIVCDVKTNSNNSIELNKVKGEPKKDTLKLNTGNKVSGTDIIERRKQKFGHTEDVNNCVMNNLHVRHDYANTSDRNTRSQRGNRKSHKDNERVVNNESRNSQMTISIKGFGTSKRVTQNDCSLEENDEESHGIRKKLRSLVVLKSE